MPKNHYPRRSRSKEAASAAETRNSQRTDAAIKSVRKPSEKPTGVFRSINKVALELAGDAEKVDAAIEIPERDVDSVEAGAKVKSGTEPLFIVGVGRRAATKRTLSF